MHNTRPDPGCCAGIFFLDLGNPVARIIGVVRRGTVVIGRLCASVQGIVRVGRHLALHIRHREQIAVGVVGEPSDPSDGIRKLGHPIERIGGIDRLLPQGIDQAAQPSCSPVGSRHRTCNPPALRGAFLREPVARIVGVDWWRCCRDRSLSYVGSENS